MTEGPEATYQANYVAKYFKHKRLRNMSIRGGRYKTHNQPKEMKEFQKQLPMKLLDVYKKGKVIFFLFEDNWVMIAKMGMTGWFSKPESKSLHQADPNIVFHFQNGDLNFTDFRNFGTLTFTQDPMKVYMELNALAPDILDPTTTPATVYKRIEILELIKKQPSMTLDTALMDQTLLLSGIGNILKSELLYDAKLSPKRTLKSLTQENWKQLIFSARKVSKRVLENLETDSADIESYFRLHAIYQKEQDPKGNPVKQFTSKDGRTTFWVPEVQS